MRKKHEKCNVSNNIQMIIKKEDKCKKIELKYIYEEKIWKMDLKKKD